MTNNEILQADMLDILFEHRNKLYGAYTLRKTYSRRLGLALGVALSVVLLSLFISFINKKNNGSSSTRNNDIIKITQVALPVDKPKEPELPREKPKPNIAQADYQEIIIVPNEQADPEIIENDELSNRVISDQNIDGKNDDDLARPREETNENGNAVITEPEKEKEPELPSREPSFPGGTAAWLSFLQKYLQSPEDLEPGQRVEVRVRFWVDIDGNVSRPEILKSGGASFDKEVLRVLKKMPKWEPALQRGNLIAVAYTQPVIFIGMEE